MCFILGNSPASEFLHTYLPIKMEETDCSETSAYKIQTPGNYPEESMQHLEQGECLKSSCKYRLVFGNLLFLMAIITTYLSFGT
jgi:hypothetical protein